MLLRLKFYPYLCGSVTAVTAPKSTKNMGGGQENTERNNLK